MSTLKLEIGEVAPTVPGRTMTIRRGYESVKPWVEFGLTLVLLIFAAPIILIGVILVSLSSPGPVFYTQRRLGRGGKLFMIYKLRTMYVDSERDGVARWCTASDPRITRIGWWLRWTHVDELPQLINVLKGEMSLVGPRPERPEFVNQLEHALPHYRERLSVRPGVTGLAQLNEPPDIDFSSVRRKLNYDLCYIKHVSFWLDIRLIFGTVLMLVGQAVGVPFMWIGRILRLPDPNMHLARETSIS
jgi:lipopolysaccharide/colanic/teichoic acid biosynthesis glycosyltransferase